VVLVAVDETVGLAGAVDGAVGDFECVGHFVLLSKYLLLIRILYTAFQWMYNPNHQSGGRKPL
jgi:hypothetical protein